MLKQVELVTVILDAELLNLTVKRGFLPCLFAESPLSARKIAEYRSPTWRIAYYPVRQANRLITSVGWYGRAAFSKLKNIL
jgi:hypothetical protein